MAGALSEIEIWQAQRPLWGLFGLLAAHWQALSLSARQMDTDRPSRQERRLRIVCQAQLEMAHADPLRMHLPIFIIKGT
jgi:hypothetical protein